MQDRETLKLYFDYKSPFAYLAKDSAFELPARFRVEIRWIPFLLRIKGKGERSIYSERKARYSYMDARRWANRRGGFRSLRIMGPPKVYDSRPALIGGLYMQQHGSFRPYTDAVYARFFERTLEIDRPEEIATLIDEIGGSGREFLSYLEGDGSNRFDDCQREADDDAIFGVPTFVFRSELFWGHDRIGLLEERLTEVGLALSRESS